MTEKESFGCDFYFFPLYYLLSMQYIRSRTLSKWMIISTLESNFVLGTRKKYEYDFLTTAHKGFTRFCCGHTPNHSTGSWVGRPEGYKGRCRGPTKKKKKIDSEKKNSVHCFGSRSPTMNFYLTNYFTRFNVYIVFEASISEITSPPSTVLDLLPCDNIFLVRVF